MTKSTITREQLLEIIETDHVQCGEASYLARMALAAMDSEPVAYIDKQWTLVYYVPPMSMGLKIGDKLYRHAQPAPVVLDEVTAEDCPAFVNYDVTEVDEAWARGFNSCRAAMLATAPHDTHALNSVQSVDSVADRWIPVSERMPEREIDVQVYCPDKKEQMVAYLERNELEGYFRFATWRTGEGIYCQPTHWMPLPAAPQEVK
ncbi:DUF551 domain-containing protein [Klebsiella pneumoniae]|uniref:DUF551 domain-containing protein n=1 Tax=Klebsiella pneumoniae TaxID=573 RepID=UPI0029596DF3|nr:DUF551 domain-containing protein [Klebsiella pneumoniae]HEE4306318.1 DUF551 domain-containing protein [Klebsiella pneumoniae]